MNKLTTTMGVLLIGTAAFSQQSIPGLNVKARVLAFDGSKVKHQEDFSFKNNKARLKTRDASWNCDLSTNIATSESVYTFHLAQGVAQKAGVAIDFNFDGWSKDNYVIIPSAAYNGNRFDVLKYPYPPLFRSKDYNKNIPITTTDVPRLNKYEGESQMDLNTGDMSTPAIGIYFPKTKKGIWILTGQATEVGNSAFSIKENADRTKATFSILAPDVRNLYYTIAHLAPSKETGIDFKKGDKVTIRYKVYTYSNLSSPKDLNNKFLAIRKVYGTQTRIDQIPFSKAFALMEKQENDWWNEKDSLFTLGGTMDNICSIWQLGWVGGLMLTLPLSEVGADSSADRSFKNYHKIVTQSQASSGFFYGCGDGKNWYSDCFGGPHPDNLHLLRKNADALYFVYKYLNFKKLKNSNWQTPTAWKAPLQKQADAFVKLWKNNGQWGQFIDMETGEIKVGGTNSASMAIAGLALAAQYENKPQYLQVAKEAARYYYKNFIVNGISCGGLGEILQNNDSESAFAMLESFVTLYETTKEKEWLRYAEDAAGLCATWMVTYDYKFPSNTLFGGLDMKTTGVVWANIQNKHGGPGICTASGDCLLKLYRATGNKKYLEMVYDVAHNIMQYIARADRPIKNQHIGWINERVNLSDWEGKEGIGDIFYGNTWAQVSAMLTVSEIPGIYINTTKKELVAFDHVQAKLLGDKVVVKNPTKFDASVSVFVDSNPSKTYPADL